MLIPKSSKLIVVLSFTFIILAVFNISAFAVSPAKVTVENQTKDYYVKATKLEVYSANATINSTPSNDNINSGNPINPGQKATYSTSSGWIGWTSKVRTINKKNSTVLIAVWKKGESEPSPDQGKTVSLIRGTEEVPILDGSVKVIAKVTSGAVHTVRRNEGDYEYWDSLVTVIQK